MRAGAARIHAVNGVEHYENFPVASVLCPPALRPAVTAIYHFARTADDIADEGDAAASVRLRDLQAYGEDLRAVYAGRAVSARWRHVFEPLDAARARHDLPQAPLADLLDAFVQDVRNPPYADRAALLDYCRRSANPIGRLLLHLYGVTDPAALRQSDAVCSALQLINFWQDLGVDLPRGRCYVPAADAAAHGLTPAALAAQAGTGDSAATRALVRELLRWACTLMHEGSAVVRSVPGRAGWELRLVIQGGLRIAAKIERMDCSVLSSRPTIGLSDLLPLLLSTLAMRA
jgi:squalene synthase HpnC